MIPMTTHQLGRLPGRARLGAFGRVGQRDGATTGTRAWRRDPGCTAVAMGAPATPAYPVFDATPIETLANSGTAHATGLASMKRTAQHLGARST